MNFKLQDFEGPLDLLLYLIEKNKMSIYNIEIASITDQYMHYLDVAQTLELDQMSEFIVMAATLLYMKSRLLLPKPIKNQEQPEEDLRAELVEKLLEYKKVKYVSQKLEECQEDLKQHCFRNQLAHLEVESMPYTYENILDNVTLTLLQDTFKQLLRQKQYERNAQKALKLDVSLLEKERYTVEQQSQYIKHIIKIQGRTTFLTLCSKVISKLELIVTFMALLELVHKGELSVVQEDKEIILEEVS